MKPSRPLELLIEMQRRERDRLAGAAAQAQRDVERAGSTLGMLRNYRQDYDSRSPKTRPAGFTTQGVLLHEGFTRKLDQAIGEQNVMVEHLSGTRDAQEGLLVEQQRKLKALEVLEQRRALEIRQRAERRDQNQTDEFATQSWTRANMPRGRP